ncbi:MAG: alpha/beta hydrolase fold domain-containing protein, partial [Pseudomonadota bacterium]
MNAAPPAAAAGTARTRAPGPTGAAALLPAGLRVPPGLLNFALRRMVKPALAKLTDPVALRARLEADALRMFRHPAGADYAEASVPGPAGARPALWAAAGGHKAGGTARRTILYLHGGAYLAGSPTTHRHLAAAIAGAAEGRALVPDYRLAPENPLPAALRDARAAWDWLVRTGHDPARIALGGDSAGGGLALALLADLTADRQRLPGAMVLFSPWCDLTGAA